MARRRIVSREADDTVVPQGNIPASKIPNVGKSGKLAGAGNCPDGKVWDATARNCVDSDTGNASKKIRFRASSKSFIYINRRSRNR